jgi:hypothetical protein
MATTDTGQNNGNTTARITQSTRDASRKRKTIAVLTVLRTGADLAAGIANGVINAESLQLSGDRQ